MEPEDLVKSKQRRNPYGVLLKLLRIAQNGLRLFKEVRMEDQKELMKLFFKNVSLGMECVTISVRYPFSVFGGDGESRNGGGVWTQLEHLN